ncbi:hypothetical protein PRIC2_012376 [Phytophthora ramorum]
MPVVYLAQITYHLIYNSDLYMIGLGTGTLTIESVVNLTCCFFAFSYAFVNLAKARSGDQQLDRDFRLTWVTMQMVITSGVTTFLMALQTVPLEYLHEVNSQPGGLRYMGLGIIAALSSLAIKRSSSKVKSVVRATRLSVSGRQSLSNTGGAKSGTVTKHSSSVTGSSAPVKDNLDELTSFETNCLGSSFKKLFRDCDDMAYVVYKGKRCTTVEALLFTGYLYYGDHIYQASSVMLLLVARLLPSKILHTFNVLLLRWRLDKKDGTLSKVISCLWYAASREDNKLAGATPMA